MAVANLNSVADYLLRFAQVHGDLITPLKLQKLVFYADAWYMALNNDTQLIDEHFEAWVHGPVVRALYRRFADYKWKPIIEPIEHPKDLNGDVINHLKEVYDVFGGYSAYELEQMTHNEKPWRSARGSIPDDEPCEAIIDKELTAKFYREMAN